MRSILVAFLLFVMSVGPVLADIEVGDIVIHRKDGEVNVRVNVHNPGPYTARAPITVRLLVREREDEPWREVKVWTNISKLAVGNRVARDYFNATPGDWDPAFNAASFQVRATATSADGREAVYERRFP